MPSGVVVQQVPHMWRLWVVSVGIQGSISDIETFVACLPRFSLCPLPVVNTAKEATNATKALKKKKKNNRNSSLSLMSRDWMKLFIIKQLCLLCLSRRSHRRWNTVLSTRLCKHLITVIWIVSVVIMIQKTHPTNNHEWKNVFPLIIFILG